MTSIAMIVFHDQFGVSFIFRIVCYIVLEANSFQQFLVLKQKRVNKSQFIVSQLTAMCPDFLIYSF